MYWLELSISEAAVTKPAVRGGRRIGQKIAERERLNPTPTAIYSF